MIFLDTTTKSVEVLLDGSPTTQLQFSVSWADHTSTTFIPGAADGVTNNTTAVELVPAPAGSAKRQVKYLGVHNADNVSHRVIVRINNNGTFRKLVDVLLDEQESLVYSNDGWQVVLADGGNKVQGPKGDDGEQGIQGETGEAGADGADGANGSDGVSFVWRGAWSGVTAYNVNDTVSSGGNSYISIQAGTNHAVTDPAYWSIMARKGDDGADGSPGAPGDDGADGADGAPGISQGYDYLFSSGTTEVNPTGGHVAFNNAAPASITKFFIHETTNDGHAIGSTVNLWAISTSTVKSTVYFRSFSDPTVFLSVAITGTTDNGVWSTFNVNYLDHSGTFSNGDQVFVEVFLTGDQGDTGAAGTPGADGDDGADGSNGSNGSNGLDAGLKYTYSTTTTASDPGSGTLRLNNTTLSSATALYISETDADAVSVSAYLASLDDSTSTIKGTLTLRKDGASGVYRIYSVTGTLTDGGAWDTLTIAHVSGSGTLSNSDVVRVKFVRTGDKGDTGATGGNGSNGSNGSNGLDAGNLYAYSTTTTASDPGAGTFRFDNATPASATALYISETDGDAASIAALLATFDDSTSTVKGYVTFRKVGTSATFRTFSVSGTLTDNGSWDTLTLANVAGSGTFTNADTFRVTFSRTGDKGDTGLTGSTGSAGSNGSNGSNGTDGVSQGFQYTYSTTTTNSDPGSGFVRFSNTTFASATSMYISETPGVGSSIAAELATWDDSTSTVKTRIKVIKKSDPSTFVEFNVTGTITDSGTWDTFTVAHVVTSGTLANNDVVLIQPVITGDKGDTGATGSAGGAGSNGTNGANAGFIYQFNTATTGTGPGTGKLNLNNGTLASATILYISETDDSSNNVAAWIGLFEKLDATPTRGYIYIHKIGTPGTFALYAVQSVITDDGAFDHVTVAHVASNGTFSNNDPISVTFDASGVEVDGDSLQSDSNGNLIMRKFRAQSSDPGSRNLGEVWYNTTDKQPKVDVATQATTLSGSIFSTIVDSTAIANTVAETNFDNSGLTLPANHMIATRTYRVTAWGFYSTTATPNLQFNVKFGSTSITGGGNLTTINNSSNRRWMLRSTITVRSTGGSGALRGMIESSVDNSVVNCRSGSATVDTTATQALAISATWGTQSSSNTVTCEGCVWEVVK